MIMHMVLVKKMLDNPEVKAEYDVLKAEYDLLEQLVKARKKAGLSQEDVAHKMGTKAPAVARIEAGGGRLKHSPSISTLRKYASAVGCDLKITLEPKKEHAGSSRTKAACS